MILSDKFIYDLPSPAITCYLKRLLRHHDNVKDYGIEMIDSKRGKEEKQE